MCRRRRGHTSKAVGYPHVLAIVLTQQDTDDPPLCLLLGSSVVVVDGGEEDEGRDRDVPGDEREGFGGGGRHGKGDGCAGRG